MKSSELIHEAENIADALAALRRAFHMDPELGNREYHTAARIEAALNGWGIPTRRLLDTAVVGVLKCALPGPCVALRADMDALPLAETTGAEFASRNPGVMHACGHDVHMTAALGAARLLAGQLPGSVVFLFQPDEEGRGGAQRMIDAGALEGVDAVFGAHVTPDLPAGHVGVRYGKFYAASNPFKIVVHGVSAHGAEREKGVDALGAAAALVNRLIDLPRSLPGEPGVVSVGAFHAGTAENVLADRAEFGGIIRTLGPDARSEMKRLFRRTVDEVVQAWGATAEATLVESYPGVVNDDAMTALAERAAASTPSSAPASIMRCAPPRPSSSGWNRKTTLPGSFYHIGAGCPLPLHNTAFLPDARAAVTAAAVHAAVIAAYLTGETGA